MQFMATAVNVTGLNNDFIWKICKKHHDISVTNDTKSLPLIYV